MTRSVLLVVLLLVLLPLALPCGPYFNDAHNGLMRDERMGTLERVYASLLMPDQPLDHVVAISHAAMGEAVAAEGLEHWTAARAAWQRALGGMGLDVAALHAWHLRFVHDRLDVLAAVGVSIAPGEWRRYAAACGMIAPGRYEDRQADRNALIDIATSGNEELAAAALTSLAWQELLGRQVDQARTHLASALAHSPHGIKADEAGYLSVIAPLFAHLESDGHVDDPRACLDAIQAWLEQHAASPWRMHAMGWQAFILFHHRTLAWGGDQDGLLAATRIWQHLLTDAQGGELFTAAVESLRYAYRLLRPAPPAWVVADPRHAAAIAWHALTDKVPEAERATMLATVRPAMAQLAVSATDAHIIHLLAKGYVAAGTREVALPLAVRALALQDVPDFRYLAARLKVELGDPAECERLAAPLAADPRYYELLVSAGSAWEERKDWARALSAYTRANSFMDVAIMADGAMPLATLSEVVAGGGPLKSEIDNEWNYGGAVKAGFDFLPMLRERLATRLVRADRAPEALALFDGELRGLCAGLISAQEGLKTATPEQRADRLYALACFWYDPGRKLVFRDRHWHQWACTKYFTYDGGASPGFDAERAHYVAELQAMTVYARAYPLFMEIADRFPADAHAPDALYKAALCRYWLTGQTYLKSCHWWEVQAKKEGYWAQGDALLKRLSHDYSDHPLARDKKVLKALEAR
jgi:hypothetical protein